MSANSCLNPKEAFVHTLSMELRRTSENRWVTLTGQGDQVSWRLTSMGVTFDRSGAAIFDAHGISPLVLRNKSKHALQPCSVSPIRTLGLDEDQWITTAPRYEFPGDLAEWFPSQEIALNSVSTVGQEELPQIVPVGIEVNTHAPTNRYLHLDDSVPQQTIFCDKYYIDYPGRSSTGERFNSWLGWLTTP